jgi:hypothetical protein
MNFCGVFLKCVTALLLLVVNEFLPHQDNKPPSRHIIKYQIHPACTCHRHENEEIMIYDVFPAPNWSLLLLLPVLEYIFCT